MSAKSKIPKDHVLLLAGLVAVGAAVGLYAATDALRDELGFLVGTDDFLGGVAAAFLCAVGLWRYASGPGADKFRAWWSRVVITRAKPLAEVAADVGKEAKQEATDATDRFLLRKGWKPFVLVTGALFAFANRITDSTANLIGRDTSSNYDDGGFVVGLVVGVILLFVWALRLESPKPA